MDKLQRRFNEADANHDGNLDRGEFFNLLKSFGVALDPDQLTKIFREADRDGDGTISFTEFKEACVGNEITEITRQRSGSVITKRDRSNSGVPTRNPRADTISKTEKDIMKRFSDPPQPSAYNQDKPRVKILDENRSDDCEKMLTAEEVREGCKYFWTCDENGDGKLSRQEFAKFLATLGLTLRRRSAERAFKVADIARNGFISFVEFYHTYVNKSNSKQVKEILDRINKGTSGCITKNQCLKLLAIFGCEPNEEKLHIMMGNIGINEDGLVSMKGFYSFMGVE